MLLTWLTGGLFLGAAVVLGRGYRRVRGTTLLAPWGWTCAALGTLLAIELAALGFALGAGDLDAWRFIAASATLCPAVALVGAKRPQNRGWQWIVTSLWLVIALPAIQHLVMGKSGALEIHAARSWFLAGLLLFGAVNSLFSRFCPAVVLAAAGQAALLNSFLPLGFLMPSSGSWTLGLIGIALAVVITGIIPRRKPAAHPLDQKWLEFRDGWGLVWSLRMLEQINVTARRNDWSVSLQWSGFRTSDGVPLGDLPAATSRVLQQSVDNLLRRFMSTESPGVCQES